jgi:RND family efflux transporter MFP subunit
VLGCVQTDPQGKAPGAPNGPPAAEAARIEVLGRTQCLLNRKATIAPAVLHPVTEVFVKPGDRVKKDQKLVQIDDDEPQADMRNKKALLDNAGIALREAKRYLAELERIYPKGSLSDKRYHEARTAALKAAMDERAAKAALDASVAELEHYTVTAAIDGIINRLEVHPGMVSRPGTTDWGEILDLSEIDVRCELTLAQVERVAVGQAADVRAADVDRTYGTGKVIFVGLAVDPGTGRVPVLVRLAPAPEGLRCGVPVRVHFRDAAKAEAR